MSKPCEISTRTSSLLLYNKTGDTVMDSIEAAKIAAIVRCIMEQMNLSKPDKDPED
ncbi:hypothetical protein ACTXT7_000092 [Hymenolepis weldensis]